MKLEARCLPRIDVIGTPVTALPEIEQARLIVEWAVRRESRVVCVANVHMTIEAYLSSAYAAILQQADLVTPDGVPLVWMMHQLGAPEQQRVAGFDLLVAVCRFAMERGVPIFLLGGSSDELERARARLRQDYAALEVAGTYAPPFGRWPDDENDRIVRAIAASGAGIVFVALGCPKQEIWMAEHRDRLPAVLVGIGAAMRLYAGYHRRAPAWMRASGLEWSFRLLQEPRRLWRRYLTTNTLFSALALAQLARSRVGRKK